jgi:hypothetical protein
MQQTGKPEDAKHSEKTKQMHLHVQRGLQHICGTSAYIVGRLQMKKNLPMLLYRILIFTIQENQPPIPPQDQSFTDFLRAYLL